MWTQIVVLVLQLGLKCIPILYQLRILKDEATLKELQRRFETAIRKAENNALDSVRLKKQHDDNLKELEELKKKTWPEEPPKNS
jgi:hypothetical protein